MGPQHLGRGPVLAQNQATQQEGSLNVMCLNHPKTMPPTNPGLRKIVFQEIGPWCQKVGDCCF